MGNFDIEASIEPAVKRSIEVKVVAVISNIAGGETVTAKAYQKKAMVVKDFSSWSAGIFPLSTSWAKTGLERKTVRASRGKT